MQMPTETTMQEDRANDSVRLRKLRAAYGLALRSTLDKFSLQNVKSSFPTLATTIPDQLEAAQQQTVEFIKSAMEEEFEIIMEQRQVGENLIALDKLIEEASASCQTQPTSKQLHKWPAPDVTTLTQVLKIKSKEVEQLLEDVKKVEEENHALLQTLNEKKTLMSF
ncbi:hypothetical protein HDV05_007898 [Chytridiales sp. JEL 0842]|nr:hypothetical protein HDV05_007898 [Chytridiales sp. JEL 0842]